MSKESILTGATLSHSPSGWWLTNLSQATSTSIWHLLVKSLFSLCFHTPAGSSIQLQPTTLLSAMNRISKSMLASKGLAAPRLAMSGTLTSPLSNNRLEAAISLGTARVILMNSLILLP